MRLSSPRSHRFFLTCFCVLTLLAMLGGIALAQSGTSISGVVRDPQDKVVSGATVTLTNTATGAVRTQKTSDTGSYSFDLLSPGDYRLETQKSGFRKVVTENVH